MSDPSIPDDLAPGHLRRGCKPALSSLRVLTRAEHVALRSGWKARDLDGYEHAVLDAMRHLSLPARKLLHEAAMDMEKAEDEGRVVTALRVDAAPATPAAPNARTR